ncbi:MAG: hypothetical protein ACR2OH_01235 [Microthrixaceae bacterium]
MQPNAVVRRAVELAEAMESLDSPPSADWAEAWFDPQFTYEDRRSMRVFGKIDGRAAYQPLLESLWVVGTGPSIGLEALLAQSGDRLALGRLTVSFGDGAVNSYLLFSELDQSLRRFCRWVDFDGDDEAAARAEFDQRVRQLDDPL